MKIRNFWSSIDQINFILILILGLLGVLLSYSVNQNFLLINKHSIFYMLSLVIIILLSQQSDKNIRRFALFGFIVLLILLASLLFFEYEFIIPPLTIVGSYFALSNIEPIKLVVVVLP